MLGTPGAKGHAGQLCLAVVVGRAGRISLQQLSHSWVGLQLLLRPNPRIRPRSPAVHLVDFLVHLQPEGLARRLPQLGGAVCLRPGQTGRAGGWGGDQPPGVCCQGFVARNDLWPFSSEK